MPVNFTGQLRSNEIFAALYNMIISQQTFADNIDGTYSELVDMARVDGSLYGDTKTYTATDCLQSVAWGNDAEATNLLKLHRPPAPKTQAIFLDIFRMIALTTDDYLSKRAWGTEGAFSEFNSVMRGWISDTKRIIDATTYNAFVGTVESKAGKQQVSINVTEAVGGTTGEEAARIKGATIAKAIADLLVALKDVSRDYNDNGFLRSSRIEDLIFIWNADVVHEIEKRDLPTVYHNQIVDRLGEHVLPSRYFGTINQAPTKGNGTTVRSLIEQDITTSDITTHYFPGDLIKTTDTAPANTSYTVDATIAFKVMHKRSIPFMSAFEVGTSFFNPRSLTETNYLIWGRNTLDYLANYPLITARLA